MLQLWNRHFRRRYGISGSIHWLSLIISSPGLGRVLQRYRQHILRQPSPKERPRGTIQCKPPNLTTNHQPPTLGLGLGLGLTLTLTPTKGQILGTWQRNLGPMASRTNDQGSLRPQSPPMGQSPQTPRPNPNSNSLRPRRHRIMGLLHP